jgi:tRNA modification GTPase
MHDNSDTIAAMATSPGESGIGIIRISGVRALAVADTVFVPARGSRCSGFPGFTAHYGWVVRRRADLEPEKIDEALLTVMRAPRTYTREDVVEISCHGGIVAMRAVLELVLENGCRLAEPGEFTRRAFINGRIDLSQAEAVLDIIKAKTDAALRIGVGQLGGELSRRIDRIRESLLGALAKIETQIDFPEEEIRDAGTLLGRDELAAALAQLERLLAGCERGRIYREGLQAVICGKPNAGKSSLLNALLKEERSIVTPVAGTTRDTIEEVIDIRGIPVRIIDTAGVLEPRDLVEKKAMVKTRERIAAADIVIIVFDGSRRLDAQDMLLMRKLSGKKRKIAVVNKTDLKCVLDLDLIRRRVCEPVMLSAKKCRNIAALEEEIVRAAGCVQLQPESVLVGRLRQIQPLKKIKKIIEETLNYRDNEVPLECRAQSLKDAVVMLDRLLGKSFSEDMLEKIFGEFCIGK